MLRLSPGARVQVFDGRGGAWTATLCAPEPGISARLSCGDPLDATEPALRLSVGVAIPKADAMTGIVRQLAELGVFSVTPLLSERSEGSRGLSRQRRWEGAALSGVRQSGGARIPEIRMPTPFLEWIESPLPEARLLALPGEMPEPAELAPEDELVLGIGPEGGFAPAEAEAALARGFRPLGLGPRILRTGTAAVVAAARFLAPASLSGR